jgi:hypothetical protein
MEPATVRHQSPGQSRSDTIARRIVLLVFVAAVIAFSFAPIKNQARKIRQGENGTKDYPLWYETGYLELHGKSPYYRARSNAQKRDAKHPDVEMDNGQAVSQWITRGKPGEPLTLKDEPDGEFPFMYPPGFAGLLAILALFGKWPTVLFIVGLQSITWTICILAPAYLLTGSLRRAPLELYWVPSLVCCVYIWDVYLEGQLAFFLSACLLGTFVCLRRKQDIAAGGLLALATTIKAFPILALPYLIYRMHWKALVSTVVFLALFFALPVVFRGVDGSINDFEVWKAGMLSPNTPERIGQRAERSYTWQNGSVLGVAHRWLRPVVADHDDNVPPIRINVADLSFVTINRIATVTLILLGIAYVGVTSVRRARDAFALTVEQSMLLILIVLATPLSFTYNTTWIMCGIAAVLWYGLHPDRSKREKIVYVVWLLAALAPLIFSIGNPNFRYIRAMGNTLASELLLLLELSWMLLTAPQAGRLPNQAGV